MKWVKKSLILITLSILGIFYAQAEPPHFEEVERVKLEVMEPCWEEYKKDEGYSSVRERSENLLDCLLSQSRKNRKVTNEGRSQTDRQSQTAHKAGSQTDRQRVPHCSVDCASELMDLDHLPDWDAEPQESAPTALPDWNAEPQESAPTALPDWNIEHHPDPVNIELPHSQEAEEYPYHKDLRVQLHIVDDEYAGEIEFDAVLPLLSKESKDRALFAQPGFILSIKDPSDGQPAYEHNHLLSANFGLVYRFTFHKGILGLNIFYDRQWDLDHLGLHHDRLSLGVDYQSGRNLLAFNQYLPLEDWKTIDEFYEERAVGGWDFIFKRLFTPKVEGTGRISYWDYSGKDRAISSIGVDYKINCQSSIGLALDKDFSTDEISGTLSYQYMLGMPEEQKKKDCLQKQYEAKGKGQLYRPVQREKRIRLEHRRRSIALEIPDQYSRVGNFFSYTISRANYRSIKNNENPEVFVTSLPDWLSYDKTSKKFSGTAPLTPKVEIVKGVILLPNHKSKRSLKRAFSFQITVQKRYPVLTAPDSTLPVDTVITVPLEDPIDEQCEVMVHPGPPNGPVVTYLPHRDGFSINCRQSTGGQQVVTGTLECENEGIEHTSNFAFKVTCQPPSGSPPQGNPIETDNSAPVLRAVDQVVHYGDTVYQTPVISNLRLNESFTVTVIQGGTGGLFVSYDSTNNRFVTNASNATERESVIIGTIQDENNNFSRWAFRVTVVFPTEEPTNEQEPEPDPIVDNQAPRLLAQDQTVRQGNSLHYAPLIDQLSLNESWTVTVGSLATDAPTVTWDADNDRFVINAEAGTVAVKEHSISGTIEDESNNSSSWSFKVTVTQAPVTLNPPRDSEVQTPPANPPVDPGDTTPPTLTAQNQSLKKGTRLNYAPTIDNLRTDEGYTVNVNSLPADAPTVTWDSTNKWFVINAEGSAVAIKEHTVSGTIQDESNNLRRWTFKVNVFDTLVLSRPQDPPDTIAPTLTAQDQSLRKGNRLNYAPTIGSVRDGEGYTVTVSSLATDAPTVTWDTDNDRFVINAEGNAVAVKEHSISGTIEDESSNSSSWSFTVTVTAEQVQNPQPDPPQPSDPPADTTAPTLTAGNKTVEIGQSTTHTPTIGSVQNGEVYTVTVSAVPNNAPSVTWDSNNKRFAINAGSASLGQYSISGTIQDASNNSNPWSFKVTVVDTQAPTLTAEDQSLRKGNRLNYAPTIDNLRTDEGYTVTVGSLATDAPSVTWDTNNARFVIDTESNSVAVKEHNVSGTIQDASGNPNSWSFKVTVTADQVPNPQPPPPTDTTAPTLTAGNKTVEIGQSVTHTPTIGSVRDGEGYTVTVHILPNNAPSVTWDSTNKRFAINATSAGLGRYTVSGTIEDESDNSNLWSFIVTVDDTQAPILRMSDLTIEQSESITISPGIGNFRAGESWTVTVGSLTPTALVDEPSVSWNSQAKKFSIRGGDTPGTYTVRGRIQDASSNSSSWSFRIIVRSPAIPTLTAQNQRVKTQKKVRHTPTITGVLSHQSFTVAISSVTPSNDATPRVSWDSENSRFVIRTGGKTGGPYTVRGRITKGVNYSNWSFTITVE